MISICIARTEEVWRKGERVLRGVKGGVVWGGSSQWDFRTEMSSSEPLEVRGELAREEWSKTASSGPLEWRAEPDAETLSSSRSRWMLPLACSCVWGDECRVSSTSRTGGRLWYSWKSSIDVPAIFELATTSA